MTRIPLDTAVHNPIDRPLIQIIVGSTRAGRLNTL